MLMRRGEDRRGKVGGRVRRGGELGEETELI